MLVRNTGLGRNFVAPSTNSNDLFVITESVAPKRLSGLFPDLKKLRACEIRKPLFLLLNSGGKCKFRTCDPCSVNAVLYP